MMNKKRRAQLEAKYKTQFKATLAQMAEKYGASPIQVAVLLDAVIELGFGRNPETIAALRAVADIADSDLPTAESLEAELAGQLH